MTWLTRLSLDHRKIVAVIALVVIALGVYLAPALKQQLLPDLSFPVISVSVQYPGAAPDVVEEQATEPIENAVGNLDGVTSVNSTSQQGGASISLSFDFGDDLDSLKASVSDAISGISTLPSTATTTVTTGSFSDSPTMTLAATTDGDLGEVGDALASTVVPKLQSIDDVESVSLTGEQQQYVSVVPDDDALATHGLDAAAVANELSTLSGASAAGVLDTDGTSMSVEVGGAVTSVEQIEQLWLSGADETGAVPVQLQDVATVSLQDAAQTSITRTNGMPSLGIAITMAADGSASSISSDVQDELDSLNASLPDGAEIVVVSDSGPQVKASIVGLLEEGLIGLVMAILVILVFLRSVRSTLVTAISIPVSLLIAIIALWVGDFSLNTLTLGGLTIAVGRVVDDSIVVLENIKRHLEYGEEKRKAIITAVREVSAAVVSSTLTTVAVFLPIMLLGGFVGQLFSPFAVAVTAAMLGSLVVSLTIIPTLAFWFLGRKPAADGMTVDEHRALLDEKESRGFLQRAYRPVLTWALKYRKSVLAGAAVVLIGTVLLAFGLKTSLIAGDNETLSVTQTLPAGTDLQTTNDAAEDVEAILSAADGIASYQVTIGSGSATDTARYTIQIADGTDGADLQADLQAEFDRIDEGDLVITEAGTLGASSIDVVLRGDDGEAVATASEAVADALRDVGEVTNVTSGLGTSSPAISVTAIGREAVAAGVTDSALTSAVAQAVQGTTVTEVTIGGATESVVVEPETPVSSIDELSDLMITTQTGQQVPLSSIATIEQVDAPASLTRTDGQRANTVSAVPVGDDTGAAGTAVQDAVDSVELPAGVTASIGGATSTQNEAFTSLIIAMVMAVALVLLILLAVFGSFAQTAMLLVSVPFAFTGAILMLRITNIALGIAGLIGMLMLIGIVVTNAIVLMDRINQNRRQGMSIHDAVYHGGLRRLRPILMTALATMIALVPMALGISGAGTFLSTPLAVVVIGGLFTSTLLTLVLIPVLYASIEEARERGRLRRAARRLARRSGREEVQPA